MLSIVTVLLLSPALVFGGVVLAQQRPACAEWRAQVEEATSDRMSTRYLGDGDARAFDRAYRHWDTTFRETRQDVRAQVAMELSEDRPELCF